MIRSMVRVALLLSMFTPRTSEWQAANKTLSERADVAVSKQTYLGHCAACHGSDGRGFGSAASELKTPPTDLTKLSRTHGGRFPEDYVVQILLFGKPIPAHGSVEMPIWGPIFGIRENGSEVAVRLRIKNLCEYLKTLQEKES